MAVSSHSHTAAITSAPMSLSVNSSSFNSTAFGVSSLPTPLLLFGETKLMTASELLSNAAEDTFHPDLYPKAPSPEVTEAVDQLASGKTLTLPKGLLKADPGDQLEPSQPTIYFQDTQFEKEQIVRPTTLGRLGYHLQSTFVDMPTSLVRGLRGDSRFRGDDFNRLQKLPYLVCGVVLGGMAAISPHTPSRIRYLAAVGLYYLSWVLSNAGMNAWVKHATGMDMGLLHRAADGKIKPVYGDPVFSRFDLLEDRDYEVMAKKMHIPADIADPEGQIQQNIAHMLPKVRVAKALAGNAFAAVMASIVARNENWLKVFTPLPGMTTLERAQVRLRESVKVIGQSVIGGVHSAGEYPLSVGRMRVIRAAIITILGTAVGYSGYLLTHLKPKTQFTLAPNHEREDPTHPDTTAEPSQSSEATITNRYESFGRDPALAANTPWSAFSTARMPNAYRELIQPNTLNAFPSPTPTSESSPPRTPATAVPLDMSPEETAHV